jgi:hypothetical protein
MPRYFFHLRGESQSYEDAVGSIFDTLESAELAAVGAASRMLEDAQDVTELSDCFFEITDGHGVCLCVVPLGTILFAKAS